MSDGEQFLQELQTLKQDYTIWDDYIITLTANITETGRCFVYFHLKELPWTSAKLREVNAIFDEVLFGLKRRGLKEVYTMARNDKGGDKLAPHFGFREFLQCYLMADSSRTAYTIFKQEIL